MIGLVFLHAVESLVAAEFALLVLLLLLFWAQHVVLLYQGLGELKESFIHTLTCFGAGFEHLQVVSLFKLSDVVVSHFNLTLLVIFFVVLIVVLLLFLVCNVNFVGQHYYAHVSTAVLFDFFQPLVQVYKRVPVGEVEDHQDSISAFVVGLGDRAIPLLASSVPDLQTHGALVDLKCSESKVNSDGRHVVLFEVVVLMKHIS